MRSSASGPLAALVRHLVLAAGVALLAFALLGCETPSAPEPAPGEDPRVEPPPPPPPPDTATSPGVVTLTLGAPEMVMNYRAESCEAEDLPDVQVNAFRRSDGSVVLVAGNAPRNRAMVGGDFTSLVRDCAVLFESADEPNADGFRNQEWIVSAYREGEVVHAFIHNEYHDPVAEHCRPGDTSPANPCWYNAITYARSLDGGRTFTRADAPHHLLAASPERWIPPAERGSAPTYGYFTPSNVVEGPDGAWYMVIFGIPLRDQFTHRGVCVLRTTNLSDPQSWRAWDGVAFAHRFGNPYLEDGLHPCPFVSRSEIQDLHGSLVYSRYLERYVLVGSGARALPGGVIECGFYISFSRDLVRWTPRQLIREAKQPAPHCSGGNPHGSEIYPSIIDHDDTTVNFEVIGETAYLYFVRWNQGLDRDLLRQEVRFTLR